MLSSRVLTLIFLLFCASKAFSHDDVINSNHSRLIFVHVIYRHGQRNVNSYPKIYPNDPYADESHWPGGFAQLTNEGKRQQYKLGQYFRRRYNKLLGDKYSPKRVYVHSSDKDRALMSALANLAGLFPPTASETWHDDIPWQPIPVHTAPENLDYVLRGPGDCPRFFAAYKKYESESPELQRIYKENAENILYWSKMCGSNLTSIYELRHVYGVLFYHKMHNKTMADWARKAIEPNGALESIVHFVLKMNTNTQELARLRSGFLIKEIFDRFSQKINSTLEPDRSVWFYSAHDTTIIDILNTLGLFELPLPPFCASVHIELYKVGEKEHYIQIFYRKSGEEILLPMKIPNCGEKCSLNNLYKLYNNVIPDRDHDTECRLSI